MVLACIRNDKWRIYSYNIRMHVWHLAGLGGFTGFNLCMQLLRLALSMFL